MAMFDSSLWVSTLLRNPKVRKSICSQHFRKYDTNGNGQLEEEELVPLVTDVCTAMKVPMPGKEDLHKSIEQYDKSHTDGLTAAEFARFFEHLLRVSLPLMEITEQSAAVAPAIETITEVTQQVQFAPSTAPDAKIVTVTDMGGSARWGPSAVDKNETVSQLLKVVEDASGSVALQLVFGDCILEGRAPLGSLTSERELQVSMVAMAADSLIAEALQALQQCPTKEQIGTRPSVASGNWSGAEVVLNNPWQNHDYVAWVDTGAKTVVRRLEQLAKMDIQQNPQSKDLVLKCLEIPPNDEVWDTGGWGYALELFPDELTSTATRLLPSLVEPGDNDVLQRAVIPWLRRVFCLHGYFSYDVGEHPNITSNMDTVLEMLKDGGGH
eukprot:TRINITY_DN19375_c0_g1_i2.p1 TRINITY_DN19375_c0_g1~~TRINITY_DN19375_c0_g1_i2.p1  ORF type:complete len:382 (+),score=63.74 TRINITY_DN19375_c0_g1_i2:63-1208(+)